MDGVAESCQVKTAIVDDWTYLVREVDTFGFSFF